MTHHIVQQIIADHRQWLIGHYGRRLILLHLTDGERQVMRTADLSRATMPDQGSAL